MAVAKKYSAGKRELPPVHPGEIWRRIITEELEISISEFANRMGVSHRQLHRILNGESRVTSNTALRFSRLSGKAYGGGAFWLRIQSDYDDWSV